jgi:hypothetical protein
MAASIRAVQTAIALVNVVIFALVFTSLWPFPSGDFNVDLPSAGEVVWDYADGVVTVSAPYSIDNGGFYDVEELLLTYDVRNYSGAPVHSGEVDIGTLPAGQVSADSIDFTFPILEMYESGQTWMVFNDDFLNFAVEVSCYYTMRLVHFYAEYNVSVPWEALIQEVEFDGASVDDGLLLVDYHVATSSIFSGLTRMNVYLYNGTDLVGHEYETIALGGYHAGTLAFGLPLSSVPDRMVLSIQVYEFSVVETVAFDPGWLA